MGVHAATDITGFGLIGHALEIAQGSGVRLSLEVDRLPVVPQALELLRQSIKPGATARNLSHVASSVRYASHISEEQRFLLADPQTSGGLLFSVASDRVDDLVTACIQEKTLTASVIGTVHKGSGIEVA